MKASKKYKEYRIVFDKPIEKTHPDQNSFDVNYGRKDLLTFIEDYVDVECKYIKRIIPGGEGIRHNELESFLVELNVVKDNLKQKKIPVVSYYENEKLTRFDSYIPGSFDGSPLNEKDGVAYGVNINGLFKRTLKEVSGNNLFGEKKLEIDYDYRERVDKSDLDFEGFALGRSYQVDFVKFDKIEASDVWKDELNDLNNFISKAKKEGKDLSILSSLEYGESYYELCSRK